MHKIRKHDCLSQTEVWFPSCAVHALPVLIYDSTQKILPAPSLNKVHKKTTIFMSILDA